MDQSAPSLTEKPIIAVCGATGFQGGSVVAHLLRDGRFAIRALTRRVNSAQAKELARTGASVVQADFDDFDSLCRAFEGCYGAYGMTDYFDAFEKESQQGINIIEAAKATKLKHLVFSAAPHIPDMEVKAFLHKAAAAKYLKASGVPYTIFMTSFYFGNVFLFGVITKSNSGGWKLSFPFPTDVPIPSMSPKDVGCYVLAALKTPSEWLGQEMRVVNEYTTPRQYAEIFGELTGADVQIYETTREQFMALENEPYIIEGWGIFKWFLDEYETGRNTMSAELASHIYPERQSWRDFLREHLEAPVPQPLKIKCLLTKEEHDTH